jgi:hypothetical protein
MNRLFRARWLLTSPVAIAHDASVAARLAGVWIGLPPFVSPKGAHRPVLVAAHTPSERAMGTHLGRVDLPGAGVRVGVGFRAIDGSRHRDDKQAISKSEIHPTRAFPESRLAVWAPCRTKQANR